MAGVTVLLLHGLGGDHRGLRELADALDGADVSTSWITSSPTFGRFSWIASTRRANASTPCGRRTRLPRGLPSGPGLAAFEAVLSSW